MDKVKVLISHYFARPSDVDTIALLDPQVEVVYGPYLDAKARETIWRTFRSSSPVEFGRFPSPTRRSDGGGR